MNHMTQLGQIYGVFVGDKLIKVGSTMRSLKTRRQGGYVKQFGCSVELRLIRKVPRPEGYSDSDFNFYLKACEALDIARTRTYVEDGGLNKISPLIQALGHLMLETERGRLGARCQSREAKVRGGHKAGCQNVKNGHLDRIRTPKVCAMGGHISGCINGPIQGRKNIEDGSIQALGRSGAGGRISGRNNVKGGHLMRIATPLTRAKGSRMGLCQRWNINREKPCTCGEHVLVR